MSNICSESSRPDISKSKLFRNLPVAEKSSAEERSHPCAKPKRFTGSHQPPTIKGFDCFDAIICQVTAISLSRKGKPEKHVKAPLLIPTNPENHQEREERNGSPGPTRASPDEAPRPWITSESWPSGPGPSFSSRGFCASSSTPSLGTQTIL